MVEPAHGDPRVVLDLRTITPVAGGGVEPFEPDEVDPVRVPSIRGQLREWWRRLYALEGEGIEEFFGREASLWGGVGVGGERAGAASKPEDGPGLRSRVILWIDAAAVRPGTVDPAGVHPAESGKSPKAMARWNGGQEFGYALFPLQRSDRERREWRRGQELPTRRVRRNLAFRLIVRLRQGGRKRTAGDPREPVRQVLATLWTWIHLGGVGARTRRGFGALELVGIELAGFESELADLAREWSDLFATPGEEDFAVLWGRFQRAANATNRLWPPFVLVGEGQKNAQDAHRRVLGCLQHFRQRSGFARDTGTRFPGRSRWPEANLLRLHRDAAADWEHPVPDEVRCELDQLGAPRAAFGLPIVMHFKSDGRRVPAGRKPDEDADGQILPQDHERWASPLLLRPVRWRSEYRPLAVVLGDRVPERVRVHYDETPQQEVGGIAVPRSAGARQPIQKLLTTKGGRAIEAFASWLIAEQDFKRVAAKADTEPASRSHDRGTASPGGRRA